MSSGSTYPLAVALIGLAFSAAPHASADVLIESIDGDGRPARVLIGEGTARIDRSDADIHVLVDLEQQGILAVNDAERYAMDMRSPMPSREEHGELDTSDIAPPEVRIVARGAGPVIAGIRTVHHRVTVDDRHCFDEYLAPDALDYAPIRRFLVAMAAGSRDDERRVLIQLMEPERLCEAAEDLIDDHYPRLGMPMRTLDAEARVIHEITRVDLDAPRDASLLRVPPDYEVLTRTQIMERSAPSGNAGDLRQRQQNIERHMRDLDPDTNPPGSRGR